MKKLWYAVMRDSEDTDWGYGSFNLHEAKEMAKNLGHEAYISGIDGGYDESGNATTNPIALFELHQNKF